MNDFASALSTALHNRALEIDMSIDMQQAERQLGQSIRSAQRRRRIWIAVTAVAAILIVTAGIALGIKVPKAQPTQPHPTTTSQQKPIQFGADKLRPTATILLPHWIVGGDLNKNNDFNYAGGYGYEQPHGSREIRLFSVGYMYPLDAGTIAHPSYAALVAYWKAVQTHGYGTVSDVATTTVGGKTATAMTVTTTKQANGFAYCDNATNVPQDSSACAGVFPNQVMHVAIVDQGNTEPPTLFWESSTTADTTSPSAAAEFATWLATVRFH
jgi:hypothetical protein